MIDGREIIFNSSDYILILENVPLDSLSAIYKGTFSFWFRSLNKTQSNFTMSSNNQYNINYSNSSLNGMISSKTIKIPSFSLGEINDPENVLFSIGLPYSDDKHILSIMSINQNFLIKVGGLKFFILNTSMFSDTNNPNDGSWVWISLGIDLANTKLFWSILTKNHNELIYHQIIFPPDVVAINFTIFSFLLFVGGNSFAKSVCFCKMNYFTYYHKEFATEIKAIPNLIQKPISLDCFFHYLSYLYLIIVPIALIYFNSSSKDNIAIPFHTFSFSGIKVTKGTFSNIISDDYLFFLKDNLIISIDRPYTDFIFSFWFQLNCSDLAGVNNSINLNINLTSSFQLYCDLTPVAEFSKFYFNCSASNYSQQFEKLISYNIPVDEILGQWCFFFISVTQNSSYFFIETFIIVKQKEIGSNGSIKWTEEDNSFLQYAISLENRNNETNSISLKNVEVYSGNRINSTEFCRFQLGEKYFRGRFGSRSFKWENSFFNCILCPNNITLGINYSCLNSNEICPSNSKLNNDINRCEVISIVNTTNETSTNNSETNKNDTNNNTNTSNDTINNTTDDSNNNNTNNDTNNNSSSEKNDTNNSVEIICAEKEVLLNGSCRNCSSIFGINDNCSDICGNGILYNFTNNIECDDGNNDSKDGCSSLCFIEKDYACTRSDIFNPDECFSTKPIIANLIMTETAKVSYIIFDREIMNTTFNNEKFINFTEITNIEIEKINKSKYSYEICYIDRKTLLINMKFAISFNSLTMLFTINFPELIRDKYNVSLSGFNKNLNDSSNYSVVLKAKMPLYFDISPEYQEKVEKIYKNSKVISYSVLIMSSVPFFWLSVLQFLWCMIDCMQLTNMFLYLDFILPQNTRTILMLFADANLFFISNTLNSFFNIDSQSEDFDPYTYEMIKAPKKFEDFRMTSLFLLNSGFMILFVLILYLIWLIIKILDKKTKDLKQNNKFRMIISKIKQICSTPFIIRTKSIIFMSCCLSLALQLKSTSTLNTQYFYNYLASYVFLIVLCYFIFHLFKICNNENSFFQVESYLKYYSPIIQQANMDNLLGRNNLLLICLRKILFPFIIVFFYEWPYCVLSLLIFLQIVEIILAFKFDIYTFQIMNRFSRFSAVTFLVSLLLLLSLKIYFDYAIAPLIEIPSDIVETYDIIGWIFLFFVFSSMIVFFLIVNWTLFNSLKKFLKHLKAKMQKRSNERKMQVLKVDEQNYQLNNLSSNRLNDESKIN